MCFLSLFLSDYFLSDYFLSDYFLSDYFLSDCFLSDYFLFLFLEDSSSTVYEDSSLSSLLTLDKLSSSSLEDSSLLVDSSELPPLELDVEESSDDS